MGRRILSNKGQRGASLVEYGILTGLISVLAIGAVYGLGTEVRGVFTSSGSSLASAVDSAETGGGSGSESGPATPGNTAPAPTGSAPVELAATEGSSETSSLAAYFADADGDILDYSLSGAPAFVTLSGDSIEVAPGVGDAGIYSFAVTANDGRADSDALTITIEVSPPPNAAPALTGSASEVLSVPEGETVTLPLSGYFSDPDGDALTYQANGLPSFATLSGGTLQIVPQDGNDGTYAFDIRASDGEDLAPALTIELTVADALPDTGYPLGFTIDAATSSSGNAVGYQQSNSFGDISIEDPGPVTVEALFQNSGHTNLILTGTIDAQVAGGTLTCDGVALPASAAIEPEPVGNTIHLTWYPGDLTLVAGESYSCSFE